MGDVISFEVLFSADNAGEGKLYDSLVDRVRRPMENLYELDGLARRKVAAFVALYAAFCLVVLKVFGAKKKRLKLEIRTR